MRGPTMIVLPLSSNQGSGGRGSPSDEWKLIIELFHLILKTTTIIIIIIVIMTIIILKIIIKAVVEAHWRPNEWEVEV